MLKKVFDLHEEITHNRLSNVCDQYGASVYPKIRLADVFSIEGTGLSNHDYRFALQSHFDFIVTNEEHTPLFAVEFDGISHRTKNQQLRDNKKNKICQKFDFPLLRINSNYLLKKYRNMDLLSWFVEMWFLSENFYKAQADGHIPYDEPFDALSIYSISGRKEKWPLWLSVDMRNEIRKLHKEARCLDPVPQYRIGIDKYGTYRGIAYLRVDQVKGVMNESAMRNQQFPIDLGEILEEIIICELFEALSDVLSNKTLGLPLNQIDERLKEFCSTYDIVAAAYYGRNILA